MKKKFDRLSLTKKSTGDPTCPVHVRRAKRISQAILSRAASRSIGLHSDEESESDMQASSARSKTLGVRENQRATASLGMKRHGARKTGDAYLGILRDLTCTIGDILSSVQMQSPSSDNITSLIQSEVSSAIAPTNHSIQKLKEMLIALVNNRK